MHCKFRNHVQRFLYSPSKKCSFTLSSILCNEPKKKKTIPHPPLPPPKLNAIFQMNFKRPSSREVIILGNGRVAANFKRVFARKSINKLAVVSWLNLGFPSAICQDIVKEDLENKRQALTRKKTHF